MANPFTSAKAPQTLAALPPDLAVEQAKLLRQQQMADLLRKQAMAPDGGTEMVSGWAVKKSPLEGVNKIAQALAGGYMQNQADAKQTDIAQKSTQQLVDGLQKYQSLLQGTPAQNTPIVDDEYGPQTITNPAVPGNKQAALAQLLSSGHPMLQQMGVAQLTAKPESAFSKVDPKDFTQESVAKFAATQNYADLVPARKMEVAPSGVAFNPYSVKEGTTFQDPNKPFNVGADGIVPNLPYQDYEIRKGKAGATNVNVKTDVKMGESLGAQVGPMMKDSTAIAEGAVKQVDAAQRIVKAVDTNKLFTGPGSTTKLAVSQIADGLGITGADEKEKIANTRSAIRGMAELTLQGRQQMKGQGAITESEGALAEKAMSGNIDDLTGAEIKQLAKASERSARFNYGEHQRKLKVMESNPSLQGIAPFYQGPSMPAEIVAPPPSTSASNNGFSIKRLP
ncbi:hypothetical protein [Herminiimonas contaminans]|uniref:Uncharacterized protein n=1 Tax=Herminiimonas contaminans TaxID=1111140 RepID=A0ABS0ES32_9BURK|nr:hypothetical protein [Herminiimonas contaminans]MBF8177654.1 hypothetical protein [Herminiimonas contaminans]